MVIMLESRAVSPTKLVIEHHSISFKMLDMALEVLALRPSLQPLFFRLLRQEYIYLPLTQALLMDWVTPPLETRRSRYSMSLLALGEL